MKPIIEIKRVYDRPLIKDGYRIFVDRLWPRGLTREDVKLDDWAKSLAPSVGLRKWFGHDPELWDEFQKKYLYELKKNKAVVPFVEMHKDKKIITLVYAAKDTKHTHALVLQQYLLQLFDEY